VGTEKRERQKANRALKQQAVIRQARADKMKRNGLRITLGIAVALIAVVGIAFLGGAFDDDDDETLTGADPVSTEDDLFGDTIPSASLPVDSVPVDSSPGTAVVDQTTLPRALPAPPADPSECPAADGSAAQQREFTAAPPLCIDPAKSYTALVSTNHGDFTIELDPAAAPTTVNNFVVLARYHYFDDTICHRIIPGFVVQCGDPDGTGTGGPGYTIPDELPVAGAYQVGSLAMANSGPDTNGSQFFVITGDDGAGLPPSYSLFGQVTDGLDDTIVALDALGNPDEAANGVPPLEEVRIESITITEA
jgi:cyclophilin family peptidyl-prolyl cis-trans isomerase